MTRPSTSRRTLVAIALTGALVATAAPAAMAKGTEVRTSGTCSKGATWKLKAKPTTGASRSSSRSTPTGSDKAGRCC